MQAQQDNMIRSPTRMSQNIQSFLTGRFKMLYMIFKSGVKNQAKEFSFFNYFNRRFPRRMLGSRKNPYCWWKCMQTIFEMENLKPFSDVLFWMLLMHSCIALSSMFNILPRMHKVTHEQGAIHTLQDSCNTDHTTTRRLWSWPTQQNFASWYQDT